MRFNHEIILGQPKRYEDGTLCHPNCLEHGFGLTRERGDELIAILNAHAAACRDEAASTADLHKLLAGPEHLTLTTPTEVFAAGYITSRNYFLTEDWMEARAMELAHGPTPFGDMNSVPERVKAAMHRMMESIPEGERGSVGMTVMEIGPNGSRVVASTGMPSDPTTSDLMPEGASIVASGNIFDRKTTTD